MLCDAGGTPPITIGDIQSTSSSRFEIHLELEEVHYIGHVWSSDGIHISKDQIKPHVDLKTPISIKEVRSVLGIISFVQFFIPNLATAI